MMKTFVGGSNSHPYMQSLDGADGSRDVPDVIFYYPAGTGTGQFGTCF